MKAFWICLLCASAYWPQLGAALSTPCLLRNTRYGSVCLCNSSYCDYLEQPLLTDNTQIVVISSSKNGLRFKRTDGSFMDKSTLQVQDFQLNDVNFAPDSILVDQNKAWLHFANISQRFAFDVSIRTVQLAVKREQRYQIVTNFGGAFTGSVSHILAQLPQDLQDHVYRSYFHAEGIAYNSIRMSIGGSDFDLEPWAYNEQPRNDLLLSNFSTLDPRDLQKVEQLKRLKSVAHVKDLKIMAAAWSAPTWMKSNERWTGFGQLKAEYYQAWAQYHLRFLELMQSKNMPVWAISTGNEPLNGVIGFFFVHFMSMGWTPWQQAIWLSENLGPTIRNSSTQSHVLIFGNDDQRYTYPSWFRKMRASRANALDYLDGLAVHWYWDKIFGPQLIDEARAEMPNKLLLNTESCIGDKPWQTHGPELGSWGRGEEYMRSYMQDLQHNFNGWLDWNLVLDEKGGPNYINNFVDSPVIVNTTNRSEFYKQPIYYAIGHFSKFLPEQSVRIDTRTNETESLGKLRALGFQRPDGSVALILYNGDNLPVIVALDDTQRGALKLHLPARSWHTVVYK